MSGRTAAPRPGDPHGEMKEGSSWMKGRGDPDVRTYCRSGIIIMHEEGDPHLAAPRPVILLGGEGWSCMNTSGYPLGRVRGGSGWGDLTIMKRSGFHEKVKVFDQKVRVF